MGEKDILEKILVKLETMDENITMLQTDVATLKTDISDVKEESANIKLSLRKIELTIENETNKKIDALFDGRVDEIRHRKENIETTAKVADLEMRVDNLEKAFKAS